MAARGYFVKLVSAKFGELFSDTTYFNLRKCPSLRQFQRKKLSFKLFCLNVNENCHIVVTIDRAGYQTKKQQEKLLSRFFLFCLLGQSHLRVYMVLFSISCATNDNSEKEKYIRGYSHCELYWSAGHATFTHIQKIVEWNFSNFEISIFF